MQPDEFFLTYMTTSLGADELLKEVRFPLLPAGAGWSFQEVARRLGDFALVGVAAMVQLDEARACSDARVALMGVNATAVRATSVEQALLGRHLNEQTIADAAKEVLNDIDPPDDVHATAAYRNYVATTLVGRTLTEAVQRVQ